MESVVLFEVLKFVTKRAAEVFASPLIGLQDILLSDCHWNCFRIERRYPYCDCTVIRFSDKSKFYFYTNVIGFCCFEREGLFLLRKKLCNLRGSTLRLIRKNRLNDTRRRFNANGIRAK
jgi:hypothetical protein